MSSLRVEFGRRLRQIRLEKGLTQEELGQLTNLTAVHISNLERGVSAPSFDSLEMIAEALDVPVCDLFEFDR